MHPSLQRSTWGRMGPFVRCQCVLPEKSWGSDLISASPSCCAPAPARPPPSALACPVPAASGLSSLWLGRANATGLERLWGQCDTSEHHGTAREPSALPGLALLGGAEIGPTWSSYRLNAQRVVGIRCYLREQGERLQRIGLELVWC